MKVVVYDTVIGDDSTDFTLTDVDVALGDVRSNDVDWPLRGGSRPGAEYLDAGTITLTMVTTWGINSEAAADSAVGRFLRQWRRGMRETRPGEMVPLYIQTGSKSRVVYGRPGRIAPPSTGSYAMEQGVAELVAEFRVLDPLVYSVDNESVTISVIPKSIGGIIAPVVTPVRTTLTSGTEYRVITVPGDAPAPLRITFHGPAENPSVRVGDAEVGLAGTLQYDEDVVVDCRARTVMLTDGRPAASRLSRRSRLDLLVLEPGAHEIAFSATDRTGTARVTVEAAPAYYHL